jgi:predicted AAA+ superfamily ATPase
LHASTLFRGAVVSENGRAIDVESYRPSQAFGIHRCADRRTFLTQRFQRRVQDVLSDLQNTVAPSLERERKQLSQRKGRVHKLFSAEEALISANDGVRMPSIIGQKSRK